MEPYTADCHAAANDNGVAAQLAAVATGTTGSRNDNDVAAQLAAAVALHAGGRTLAARAALPGDVASLSPSERAAADDIRAVAAAADAALASLAEPHDWPLVLDGARPPLLRGRYTPSGSRDHCVWFSGLVPGAPLHNTIAIAREWDLVRVWNKWLLDTVILRCGEEEARRVSRSLASASL